MYSLVDLIHSYSTSGSQPLHRGSLASSHANTAGELAYRDTTALTYRRYAFWMFWFV